MNSGQQDWGAELAPCLELVRTALQAVVDGERPRPIPEEACSLEALSIVRLVNHLIVFAADPGSLAAGDCPSELVTEFAAALDLLMQRLAEREERLRTEFARREQAELRLQRERDLLVAGPLVTLRWGSKDRGSVEYVSPNIAAFGYDAEDFMSGRRRYGEIVHPEDAAWLAEDADRKSRAGLDGWTHEYRLIDGAGRARWVRDYTHPVRAEDGAITCYEGYVIDVTQQKQTEEELRRREEALRMLSLADDLTGLYNRRGLFALGEHLLRQARRHGRGLRVLYVDVDDLRRINDDLGREQGDQVLRRVAAALRAATRESDVLARTGGDEFVALVEDEDDDSALSRRLRRRLATPKDARGPRVTVSIGELLWSPDQPADLQELIDGAAADLRALPAG